MKKLLALALALALTLSLSVTAFAAEGDTLIGPNTDPKTGDTTVHFNVDPTYTVTIPAKVELTQKTATDGVITYESDAEIKASAGVRLYEKEVIQVTMNSDLILSATSDPMQPTVTTDLPYTVTVGDPGARVDDGGVVAIFGTDTAEQISKLHFAAENPTYAGDYSDTVTFTIAIVKPVN